MSRADGMRRAAALLLVAGTLGACAERPPAQRIIENAAAALGGRDRVEAVETLSIAAVGSVWNLGQDMTPDATGQRFTISEYVQQIDLAGPRGLIEQTRTPNFTYFRGQDPIRQRFGVDGEVAYDVAPDGSASRASNAVAADRRDALYHHPLVLVRAALNPAATLANARTTEQAELVDVTTADGRDFTLAVDAATGRPVGVSSRATHPNLRDVTLTTAFADYQEVDGLMLPARLTSSVDNYRLSELEVASQQVNGEVGDLAAPATAASAAPIAGSPPPHVTADELADGVWFLAGESHNSVLVEFDDHLVLIEAPNEARTLAVIAKARELVPDKPLTQLVNTHHHFDHSGGVRAAIAEGVTIVTQAANGPFYEALASRPSTIAPDALARNPQPLSLRAVDESMTLEDRTMTVELYRIVGNPHADTLLMAYLPRQRLLVEADAFSPGRELQPFAANLLENIERLDLRVDRLAPIHGAVVRFSALTATVRALTH